MNDQIPIYVTDWMFVNKKGIKFIVKDIPTKCHDEKYAMTNSWSVKRALKYLRATDSIKKNLIPLSVKLKKQIGFGKYEKHELYSSEKK
jgi:hypothetical protein